MCGQRNPWSLELAFRAEDDGGVTATFQSHSKLQGYDHLLHGGVIAALLDAAMTHCLFHSGVQGLTAALQVRFERVIPCDAALVLRARILDATPRLYRLRAEAVMDGVVMAWGEGKFMPQPRPASGSDPPAETRTATS